MTRVVGVDPGLTGALGMIDGERHTLLAVGDIHSADGVVMAGELSDLLADWSPDLVVVEAVHSMPGAGVRSMFTFGRALGTVEGIVAALGIPEVLIPPHQWKQIMHITKDKASARAQAAKLWPQHRDLFARVKDTGRAEAALIALAWQRKVTTTRSGVQQSATWRNGHDAEEEHGP